MTSGRRVALSTALLMVVEDGQKGIGDVTVVGVVVVVVVVVLVVKSTTCFTTFPTKVSKPCVKLRAGLAVVLTGAVMLVATSSKILDGRNTPASISGSHLTRIGAIIT